AWKHGRAGVAWARELRHPPSEGCALLYLSGLPHYEGDRAGVLEIVRELQAHVDRYGLLLYKAFCGVLYGWAEGNSALALSCLDGVRGTGQEIGVSYWLALVAEAECAAGRTADALARIDEGIAHARKTGEAYYLPELHRFKGEVLANGPAESRALAEASLRSAIELAREQGQRPSELRASLALGRLLRTSGRLAEARELVATGAASFAPESGWSELRAAREFLDTCG
ncbi:MAG: hypothetical protein JOZ69_11460, partial [Myxococcales bacterium]|nr:hypothetical protein [Myxococcales bacterium]